MRPRSACARQALLHTLQGVSSPSTARCDAAPAAARRVQQQLLQPLYRRRRHRRVSERPTLPSRVERRALQPALFDRGAELLIPGDRRRLHLLRQQRRGPCAVGLRDLALHQPRLTRTPPLLRPPACPRAARASPSSFRRAQAAPTPWAASTASSRPTVPRPDAGIPSPSGGSNRTPTVLPRTATTRSTPGSSSRGR